MKTNPLFITVALLAMCSYIVWFLWPNRATGAVANTLSWIGDELEERL